MPDPSPAFNPPMNRIIDNDPQIVRVSLENTEWGFRKSSEHGGMVRDHMTLKTLSNAASK